MLIGRKRPVAFLIGAVSAATVALLAFGVMTILAGSGPQVTSDKGTYVEYETALLSGTGFDANQILDVVVSRPDGSVVTGDGSQAPGWDVVLADSFGTFSYSYWLNWPEEEPLIDLYTVWVYPAGVPHTSKYQLAKTTFWFDDTAYPASRERPQGDRVRRGSSEE